ncbi:MAG TPA: hypothetical protein VGK20_06485, partial [Candidatus Binatia bacterium]
SNTVRLVILTVVGLVALYLVLSILGVLIGTRFVWGTVDYVVDNLSSRSGISPFLVRGATILGTIPFFMAVSRFTGDLFGLMNLGWASPLGFFRRQAGIVIVCYIAGFFVLMYYASVDAYAYKFCADTREGIWTSDGPGKDPVYGVETKPCTPDQIATLRHTGGKLAAPKEIHVADVGTFAWFDSVTGKPNVWYSRSVNGHYRFFDRQGNDPTTGEPLRPITHEVIEQLSAKAEIESSVHTAHQQYDAGNFQGVKEACDRVLASSPANPDCKDLRARAGVKLAQDLVKKGQSQSERGQFDEALWNAREALKLDPSNANATKLEQFALRMKPQQIN